MWPTFVKIYTTNDIQWKEAILEYIHDSDPKSQFGRVKFLECSRLIQSEVS